jgi:hypothetical protein
MVRDDHNAVQL